MYRLFLKDVVCNIPTDEKLLYLTFDDGPVPEATPFVLEQLKRFNAKATFFCIGNNIEKNPEIFKSIVQNGNRIGNHTFDHINGWKFGAKEYAANVEKCEQIISNQYTVIGQKPDTDYRLTKTLFRPPYGKITPSQYAVLNNKYSVILWDVLSWDFNPAVSPEKCLRNVLNHAKPGSIIVFHDSIKAFKNRCKRECLFT